MSATARLLDQLEPDVDTVLTADGEGWLVVLVVPGQHRTQAEAELSADLVHDCLQAALSDDLGPLRVTAQRLPVAPPITTEKETSR